MQIKCNISVEAMEVIINNFYFVEGLKFQKDEKRDVSESESSACKFIVKMQKQIARLEENKLKVKNAKRTPNKTS